MFLWRASRKIERGGKGDMRTILRPIVFLLVVFLGVGIASAQDDVVLVQGNPPHTQLTVGKSIVLL